MAEHTFKNGARESVTTVTSLEVKASEQSANASAQRLELVSAPTAGAADLVANAVVASARNSLNAPTLLRQFAQAADPLESALAGLFRANTQRTACGLKTVAAALFSAQGMPAATAQKFLTRLGLHLIAVESEASIDQVSAHRLLALAGIEGMGEAQSLATSAIAGDNAYDAEFQAQIVATAVLAGRMVAAQTGDLGCSLRARLGYAGPRHQRRAASRRPRAAVRAAERALVGAAH